MYYRTAGWVETNIYVSLFQAHGSPVMAFDFNPFDENMLVTGSRENEIKVWRIPEEGIQVPTLPMYLVNYLFSIVVDKYIYIYSFRYEQ